MSNRCPECGGLQTWYASGMWRCKDCQHIESINERWSRLLAENAKLREELDNLRSLCAHASMVIGGVIATTRAELGKEKQALDDAIKAIQHDGIMELVTKSDLKRAALDAAKGE